MKRALIIFSCMIFINYGFSYAQTGENNAAKKKITIGMIGKNSSNPVFMAAYTGARVAAKELGAKYNIEVVIDWQTPESENVQQQASALERLSHSGANGIAIACTDANYLKSMIDKVAYSGIPIMCFDSDAPKSKRFAYYGADDIEFGKMLMKQIAAEINGKASIAILAGNKHGLNLQRRLKGIKDELKKHPNITVAPDDVYYNLDVPDLASKAIKNAQNKHPYIKGWILIGSSALQVKNSLKWNPGEIKVVAGNAIPTELEYVKSGHVQSLVGVNCFQMGYKSIEILLEKILNKHNPKESTMFVPLEPVTKANVDSWSYSWKKWLIKEAVNR